MTKRNIDALAEMFGLWAAEIGVPDQQWIIDTERGQMIVRVSRAENSRATDETRPPYRLGDDPCQRVEGKHNPALTIRGADGAQYCAGCQGENAARLGEVLSE